MSTLASTLPDLTDSRRANRAKIWAWLLKLLQDGQKWKPEYEPDFALLVDYSTEYHDVQRQLQAARAKAIAAGEPGLAYMLKSAKGTLYPNPLINHRAGLVNTIHRLASSFGLNPLADARVKAIPAGEMVGELLKLMMGGEPEA